MRKNILLQNAHKDVLFQGHYNNLQDCLKDAIGQGTNLRSIDLSHQNLSGFDLDGAIMPYANFSHANLTGSNLSEATLDHSIFDYADLYNCCLAQSSLQHCSFKYCNIGGTDIYHSTISYSQFHGLSFADLSFHTARAMDDCMFWPAQGRDFKTSQPPIVIKGNHPPCVILGDTTMSLLTNKHRYR